MTQRNGLLKAFTEISEAISSIEALPDCQFIPLPPSMAAFPSMYIYWDDETFELEHSDLKWMNPLKARLLIKVWLYIESVGDREMVFQLMEKVQLIKDKMTATTTIAESWCGNVVRVVPMYGVEPRNWAGAEISILVAEYT